MFEKLPEAGERRTTLTTRSVVTSFVLHAAVIAAVLNAPALLREAGVSGSPTPDAAAAPPAAEQAPGAPAPAPTGAATDAPPRSGEAGPAAARRPEQPGTAAPGWPAEAPVGAPGTGAGRERTLVLREPLAPGGELPAGEPSTAAEPLFRAATLALPDTMRVGEAHPVRLRLQPSRAGRASARAETEPRLRLTAARAATLDGEGFRVQATTPPLQVSTASPAPTWAWTVRPTTPGRQRLVLRLEAVADSADSARIVTLARIEQEVVVRPTPAQRLAEWGGRLWKWLLVFALAALWSWLQARRRQRAK